MYEAFDFKFYGILALLILLAIDSIFFVAMCICTHANIDRPVSTLVLMILFTSDCRFFCFDLLNMLLLILFDLEIWLVTGKQLLTTSNFGFPYF